MQVIIYNVNTQIDRPSCKRKTNTSRHVDEEKSETGTHCRLRGICNNNNTSQYKARQYKINTSRQGGEENGNNQYSS